jgi:tetratricopeptide (TPR) repeat protein
MNRLLHQNPQGLAAERGISVCQKWTDVGANDFLLERNTRERGGTMKKRKRSKPVRFTLQKRSGALQIVEYEITPEPIPDSQYESLPPHAREAIDRLYHLALERPSEAIPELRELIDKYPDIPRLYNFLSAAYQANQQYKKAEQAIRENYRRNPDYLFARLNYAGLCMEKGDYAAVARIFDHKFDLKLLYPERKKFHISEVTGFMGIMGRYFYAIGEVEAASLCLGVLMEINPESPQADRLTRLLATGLIRNLFGRLRESLRV